MVSSSADRRGQEHPRRTDHGRYGTYHPGQRRIPAAARSLAGSEESNPALRATHLRRRGQRVVSRKEREKIRRVYLYWGGEDMDIVADKVFDGERGSVSGNKRGGGLAVGYIESPFVGRTIAHTGPQSMSLYYNNGVGYSVSEAGWCSAWGYGWEQLIQTPYISDGKPAVQTSSIYSGYNKNSTKSHLRQLQPLYGHSPQCYRRHQ